MTNRTLKIGEHLIGDGQPVYIVAEIGINHNGDLNLAKQLIDAAHHAGCDAVKFQKRTPELAVPEDMRERMRDTPWGYISYMEYRQKVEFGFDDYAAIDTYCREIGIAWFVSCWDEASVDFIEQFNPATYKIASASLTDESLLLHTQQTGKPLIVSTGMSTAYEIERAINLLDMDNLVLVHTTSTYPCPNEQLNLRMIETLHERYPCPIGYSGHEVGLQTTLAAVALGACFIERHITINRTMWGSDQASSVEPHGFKRLVRDIRAIESALGDGQKRVYDSEKPLIERLRRIK